MFSSFYSLSDSAASETLLSPKGSYNHDSPSHKPQDGKAIQSSQLAYADYVTCSLFDFEQRDVSDVTDPAEKEAILSCTGLINDWIDQDKENDLSEWQAS